MSMIRERGGGSNVRVPLTQNRRTMFFLYPAMAVMLLLSVYTTLYSLYLSTHSISLIKAPPYSFSGLQNYLNVVTDSRAWSAFGHSLQYVFSTVVVELLLGLAIALFLHRDFPGRRLVRALLLIPMIMTPVVAGLVWRIFYDPNSGFINYLLSLVNPNWAPDWLGDPHLAMGALVLADVWQWTPFVILILMAGLDAMSHEPHEAAKIDGASPWQTLRFVTLPLLAPTLLIAVTLRIVDSFKAFDLIYVMTRGGPALSTETVNMYAYIRGFNTFDLGYAVALSFLMTLIVTFGLSTLYRRMLEGSA